MSTQTLSERHSRLSCRVSSRIKQRAEEAASLLGQSITDFTESALADKADAVIAQHSRIAMSERDFEKFVAAIDNPKPPTQGLVDLMRDFKQLRADRPEANL